MKTPYIIEIAIKYFMEYLMDYFEIHYFRNNLASNAKEIIIPFALEDTLPGIKYTIPLQSDKGQLLALSQKNANYALQDWEYKQKLVQVNTSIDNSVLEELQE